MTSAQSLWHGFLHTVISFIAVAIPVIIMGNFSWESLSIGSVLAILGNWAKIYSAQ